MQADTANMPSATSGDTKNIIEEKQAKPKADAKKFHFSRNAAGWQLNSVIRTKLLALGWIEVLEKPLQHHLNLLFMDRGLQTSHLRWPLLTSKRGLIVNYFRSCFTITDKVRLAKNMRYYYEQNPDAQDYTPQSFILEPRAGERKELAAASEGKDITWIVKSDKGAKGEGIIISPDVDEILAFVDAQYIEPKPAEDAENKNTENTPVAPVKPWKRKKKKKVIQKSWICQRYIDRPFLIAGRKFDIRVWVLCMGKDYSMYVYDDAVFRTSSVQYKDAPLSNIHAHLTNHCIQATHENYGVEEEGNELFYAEFQTYLDSINSNKTVEKDLKPQINAVVRQTLLSAKDVMEPPASAAYSCYQLFGYDLMIDADFGVHLLEINATPAAAAAKVDGICTDLLERLGVTELSPDNKWIQI